MTKRNRKGKKGHGLLRDQRGLTTVEYIIILSLITVVGFGVWKRFGMTVRTKVHAAETTIGTLPEESAP